MCVYLCGVYVFVYICVVLSGGKAYFRGDSSFLKLNLSFSGILDRVVLLRCTSCNLQ